MYNYYDSDHDGLISHSEVADAMRVASGEGLSSSQLDKVMTKSLSSSLLFAVTTHFVIFVFCNVLYRVCDRVFCCASVMQVVHAIMQAFDVDKDGCLNFKEFCCLMRDAGLQYNL